MKNIYYDSNELDEDYKAKDLDKETVIRENEDFILRETEKEVQVRHRANPRMEELRVDPLKRPTPEIIGGLFDRARFLKERIEESNAMIESRKSLHDQVVLEIDADISEKKDLENKVADIDEKRNLKLDISILRKEKRHEQLQFWRDVLELRTELRTLMEEHEVENKIVGLFSDGDKNEIRE